MATNNQRLIAVNCKRIFGKKFNFTASKTKIDHHGKAMP